MNAKATYILVLFALWGFISGYWYTCDIKGFCGTARAERLALIAEKRNEEVACTPPVLDSLQLGWKNPENQVRALELFLNTHEGEALVNDGFFGQDDLEAITRFQAKYAKDILEPYGRTTPTGFVHTNTKEKINELACAAQKEISTQKLSF